MSTEPEQHGSRRARRAPDRPLPARARAAGASEEPFARLRPSLGGRRLLTLLWGVAVVVVALDQLTKLWAVAALSDGQRVSLVGDWLTLHLIRNPGAAFSFATGQTWFFSLVAVVVAVVIVRVSHRLGSRTWAVTLGLVMGGAVGNLIDRLVRSPGVLRGHVVDFISYGSLFIGNVADVAIVVAALAIMLLSLVGLGLDGTRDSGERRDGERAAATVLGAGSGTSPGGPLPAEDAGEQDGPAGPPALEIVDDLGAGPEPDSSHGQDDLADESSSGSGDPGEAAGAGPAELLAGADEERAPAVGEDQAQDQDEVRPQDEERRP